jgi:hypothetical protein
MRRRPFGRRGEHALGALGLLLVLVLGKLAPYVEAAQQTYLERARGWLARRAMDGIAAIGWLMDRLPRGKGPVGSGAARRARRDAEMIQPGPDTRPASQASAS